MQSAFLLTPCGFVSVAFLCDFIWRPTSPLSGSIRVPLSASTVVLMSVFCRQDI